MSTFTAGTSGRFGSEFTSRAKISGCDSIHNWLVRPHESYTGDSYSMGPDVDDTTIRDGKPGQKFGESFVHAGTKLGAAAGRV